MENSCVLAYTMLAYTTKHAEILTLLNNVYVMSCTKEEYKNVQ